MSNRIDLTWLEGDKDEVAGTIEDNICGDYDYVENLLTELKRCYEEIDEMKAIVLETFKFVQSGVAPFGWESYLMKRFNLIGEHLGLLKSASE